MVFQLEFRRLGHFSDRSGNDLVGFLTGGGMRLTVIGLLSGHMLVDVFIFCCQSCPPLQSLNKDWLVHEAGSLEMAHFRNFTESIS
jgi:hypothetical protein